MSVPKVRRVPSPHHVSDRLRRARNCSSERNTITHLGNSTEKIFKSYESTARIQMTSKSSAESKNYPRSTSNLRQSCEPKHSHDQNSIKLPERVLKLVVTPCAKDDGHCSSFSSHHGNDHLNVVGIYNEVLKELKQEVRSLEGANVYVPYSENPILGLFNECFQVTYNSSNSSSVLDSRKGLLHYAIKLTVECVEIIERVIYQQSEVVVDFNKESSKSTRKKIKTLLLNVMLGIEHELINSEKILEIVDTDLHYPSFQFIYCLLKRFIEKIASYLKLSNESGLCNTQSKVMVPEKCFAESSSCTHSVSGPASAIIPDHKVEEYSNRLEKLLKQWTGTGDSSCKIEHSQQVVIDCYHCLGDKKDKDLLLKTVSRFTEEIKRKLVDCHRADMRTQSPESSKTENPLEAPKIIEQSNDTVCSTEMPTYYSWNMTGQNPSRRDRSRSASHYSNCQRPMSEVSPNRSNCFCQDCTRNNGSNYGGISPSVACGGNNRSTSPSIISVCNNYRSMHLPMADGNNYRSIPPSTANGNNNRSMSPPIFSGNNYRSMNPPMADGNNYRSMDLPTAVGNSYRSTHPPMADGNNNHSMHPPMANGKNYRSIPPTMANGSNNRSMPLPTSSGNNYRSMAPPMADGNSYRSMDIPVTDGNSHRSTPPPLAAGNNSLSMTPPMANSRNYRSMASPMALKPFPKLQLPNFNLCKTIGSQNCSHLPRCIIPVGTNQMHKLCDQGNQMIGNNCGKCLVICENNPKPPYYDRFPGFKDAGFYGSKYVNTFQPQLFNSFSVSPGYGDEKKTDQNSKKGKNKERKSTTPDKERKRTSKERRSLSPFKDRKSLTPNIDDKGAEQMNGRKSEKRRSPTRDDKKQDNDGEKMDSKAKKEKPQKEQSPDRDVSKKENRIPEKDSIKTKESDKNKDDTTKIEHRFEETPPARLPSRTNVAKPSTPKSADLSKPSQDALRRNDNTKVTIDEKDKGKPLLESKSREEVVEGKNSANKPSDTDRKKSDDHCTCCKCKKNNGDDENASMFVSPCHCNGMNNQDSSGFSNRPIYQFFANPVPVACNCQNKSDANKSPSEVPKSKSQHQVDPAASNEAQKKRDSQDAETQTGKKPKDKSDSNLSGPNPSEPSAGQITPAQSKNDQEPCIENSESCTCTVIYSRSSSRHRRDSQNVKTPTQKNETKHPNKTDSKCTCPRDIEDIFQEFDDKYAKCVQEIKLLIREGYIPRYNGSDESFTVTREIKITPSKSACKDTSKVPPQQQLRFGESQDKIISDDSYRTDHQNPPDLREDIEELKRLVKNARIGHCPCCKCCKCENDGKVVEECSKDKDSSDSKKQSGQKEPGKYQSESFPSRDKLPKRYSSKEIEESNKEPPKGAKVIHISPSYVEPELPKSVQELITPPESKQTKASSSERNNSRPPSNPDTTKSRKQDHPKPERQSKTKYPRNDQTRSSKSNTSTRSPPQGSDGEINQPKTGTTRTHEGPNKNIETKSEGVKEGSDPVVKSGGSKVAGRALTSSESGQGFEISEESLEVGKQQQEGEGYFGEPQRKPSKESGMKVSKISVGDGKLSIVITSEPEDTKIRSDVTTAGSSSDESDTDEITGSQKPIEPGQDPLLAAEGESTGVKRDTKEPADRKKGLKSDDGLKTEDRSETSLQNESEFLLDQNAESRTSKKPLVETKPESVGYDKKSTPEKKRKKVALVYDDEAKQRQISLERQALNESREQLFSNRRDNVPTEREKQYLTPKDDEVKKSWNPFESIFGVFGDKAEEGGTDKKEGKGDNIEEYSKMPDDKVDEQSMSEEPKSGVPCERDDDGDMSDGDFSSCAVGHPCGSTYSSCSTIDECRELLDSLPCNFFSDESVTSSITEVIKTTETELYVMIIESQPPVAQTTDRHDKIISLLLSGNNNADFSGNGNTENQSTHNNLKTITLDNVAHTSTTNRSYTRRTYQNERGSHHCFPVELISSQRSYESLTLGSDIESSNELLGTSLSKDQPHSTTRIGSPSLQNIQQEMRERNNSCHSKQQEEKERPRPCRNPPEKKKRPCQSKQKHSGDLSVPSLQSQITVKEVEFTKKTENKEVQVTKWNAKVQTAGPRKFNRTDIPREVEDKLAVYLGLERTVEQTDLKVTPTEERAQILRDADDRGNPTKEESKRTYKKNRRNLKFQD